MTALLDFLNFVLPWGDDDYKSILTYYTDRTTGKDMPVHHGFKDVASLENAIRKQEQIGKTAYIAVQSHKFPQAVVRAGRNYPGGTWYKGSARRRETCHLIQCFYADIDFKNGWADAPTAIAGLEKFCDDVGIPHPSLYVYTGGGIHAYWRLDQPLSPQAWLSVATCLAEAMKQHNVPADHMVTIDTARILRPPETHNRKYDPPRPVQMTQPGASYALSLISTPLAPYATSGPRLVTNSGNVVGTPPKGAASGLAANFMSGMQAAPVDLYEAAKAGCLVLYEAYDTNGATDDGKPPSQGLWNLLALAATFDLTPAETFEELSDAYPGYSAVEAAKMLKRKIDERAANPGMGWPSCRAFSAASTSCQKCVHLSKGLTPLHLAKAQPVAPGQQAAAAPSPDLPTGYWRDITTGYVKANKATRGGHLVPMTVFEYEAKDAELNDLNELEFEANLRKGGWTHITVPLGTPDTKTVIGHLSRQGAYVTADAGHTVCRDFIMAWAQHIQSLAGVTAKKRQLGWDADENFSFGTQTFTPTGPIPATFAKQMPPYIPKGQLQPWLDVVKMQTDQGRPAIDAIIAAAGAAPLVELAGNDTTMFAVIGESGVGKSTAIRTMCAMWGHPTTSRYTLSDTENSLMKTVSMTRNLPVAYDEIKTAEDSDKLVRIAFQLSQNKEKARLDANSNMMEAHSFRTLLVAGSNHSISDIVTSKTKSTTAGAVRVFEVEVAKPRLASMTTMDADKLLRNIEANYGRAGEVYADWLVRNRKLVLSMLDQSAAYFEKTLAPKPEERFWVNTIRILTVGAECLNRALGTQLGVAQISSFLVAQFDNLRSGRDTTVTVVVGKQSLGDVIYSLMGSIRGKHLIETHYFARPTGQAVMHTVDDQVAQRVTDPWAHLAIRDRVLRVHQSQFRDWFRERKMDYRAAEEIGKGLMAFTENTNGYIGVKVSGFEAVQDHRKRCWDIDLSKLT